MEKVKIEVQVEKEGFVVKNVESNSFKNKLLVDSKRRKRK